MVKKRRTKTAEHTRNFFLVVLAVMMIVIFFNLDIIREGESVFSKTSEKKLKFTGDLGRSDFTKKEVAKVMKFLKKYDKLYQEVIIQTSKQDSYKKVGPTSEILFDIRINMIDGSSVTTPTRRIKRNKLSPEIIAKLKKDLKAYKELKDKGTKVKSLVNTM